MEMLLKYGEQTMSKLSRVELCSQNLRLHSEFGFLLADGLLPVEVTFNLCNKH